MRVLQVSPGYPPDPGGVERHVQEVSEALVRLGHQVTVLALGAPSAAPSSEPAPAPSAPASGPAAGLRVLRMPARSAGPFRLPVGLGRRLAELAAEHDVLHVHNYHSPLPLIALGAARGLPVVVSPHFHGGGHTPAARLAHPLYRALFRARLPRAAGCVFVSAAEQERFRREFGEPVPGLVVHNGVRTPGLPARRPAEAADGDPLVLAVGRLERYKRVDLLLEALAALPADRRWRAEIVGDGPDRSRLEAVLARLAAGRPELSGRIRLAGRVDDATLDRLLGGATVTVSTSAHEAFGMAALDAVAAGCPVVASDLPAHRELAGLAVGWIRLWDPGSGTAALAGLVDDALTGPAPAGPVPLLPTWDRAAERLAGLYTGLVADRRRPPGSARPPAGGAADGRHRSTA